MQIELKKYLFIGLLRDKSRFFLQAQEAGCVEFTNQKKLFSHLPPFLQNLKLVISILKKHAATHTGPHFDHLPSDSRPKSSLPGEIVVDTLALHQQAEELDHQYRLLEQEKERITPFGNVLKEDLDVIERDTNYLLRLFTYPQEEHSKIIKKYPELLHISSAHELNYYAAIHKKEGAPEYSELYPMVIERSLSDLIIEEKRVKHQLLLIQYRLSFYALKLSTLEQEWYSLLNQSLRTFNENSSQEVPDCHLFAVKAWVPVPSIPSLKLMLEDICADAHPIEIEPGEVIPTHLMNNQLGKMGEDLVEVYDTPSPSDPDPSTWVLFCFALFFGMIVGDAGYGVIYLGIALYFQYRRLHSLNWSKIRHRVVHLMTLLSISCIFWGVSLSTFFGYTLNPENPLRKISFIEYLLRAKAAYHVGLKDEVYSELIHKYPGLETASSSSLQFLDFPFEGNYPIRNLFADNVMLELALLIGVIHITCSFLRVIRTNKAGWGWIAILWGGYFYFANFLHATSMPHFLFGCDKQLLADIGLKMAEGGAALVLGLAVWRSIFLGPLHELMVFIQLFSDVMSYLRLYALALSGGMMSATFNSISAQVPLFIGVIIFVMGHSLNISLNVMSGVLHGLRLNFLEWYHYSFTGGGRRFTPLKFFNPRD